MTFWDATTHEARRLRDPSGSCRTLAISPDGLTLATGGDGKVVTLWDLATGRERATLTGHDGAITCLAFAPDGKTLASGSRDASVTLWDVAKPPSRTTLARHTSAVTCLAFAPDGNTIATGSLDWTVKIWDLASGVVRHSLDGHKAAISAVAFLPDGRPSHRRALTARPGSGRSPAVSSGTALFANRDVNGPLVFLGNGRSLFTGGSDGSLRRWDLADGQLEALRKGAHRKAVTALALSADGKTLASGGADCELRLWEVDRQLAPGRSRASSRRCGRWRSAPTATCSSRRRLTVPSRSGTRSAARDEEIPSSQVERRSVWHSRRMGKYSPHFLQARFPNPCSSGTRPPGASGTFCTPRPAMPASSPSRPTAGFWCRPAGQR